MQIFCPQIASLTRENSCTNPRRNNVQKRHSTVVGAFDCFHCAELSSTEKLIRMVRPGVDLSLVYFLFLLPALSTATSQKGTDNDNNSGVSNTQSKCHNVYTSNNFYAGPNKKIEALLLEIKDELGEVREEIKSLKENKTGDEGKQDEPLLRYVTVLIKTTNNLCVYLAFFSVLHTLRGKQMSPFLN